MSEPFGPVLPNLDWLWARVRRIAPFAVALAALLWIAAHVAAISTESVNWDEFAQFRRTADMVRTGKIQGGGRPGLVEPLLAPLVAGCTSELKAIRTGRWIWAGVTVAALAGFYRLLVTGLALNRQARSAALAGVALLALVPAFLRWSLQVRTDQLALACGLWAGVLLIAARERLWRALAGGVLAGVGFLFTQKLAYVLLLAGIVAAHRYLADESAGSLLRRLGRGLSRVALLVCGALLVLAVFRLLATAAAAPPPHMVPTGQFHTFDHYRTVFGFAVYRSMVPTLTPHLILLGLLALASARALVARNFSWGLATAWALVAAGTAVGLFHRGAFPYFWMTLGLFPCAAVAVAWPEITGALPPRWRGWALMAIAALLVAPAARYSVRLLEDSQATQREAFDFIDRNFSRQQAGFQLEGALFCRPDPAPFPVYFRDTIEAQFRGPGAPAASAALIERFRAKQVAFLIDSHMTGHFTPEVHSFWAESYLPYRAPVMVAGRMFAGKGGETVEFEIVAGGRYRWRLPRDVAGAVEIDGSPLAADEVVELSPGAHRLTLRSDLASGALMLDLADPPVSRRGPFYGWDQVSEIVGGGFR